MPPWVDTPSFFAFIKDNNFTYKIGNRNNRTDGEVHYIISSGSKELVLKANRWQWSKKWDNAIIFVKENRKQKDV